MALTTTEQNRIVSLLGYPGKILQSGSVNFNQIFTDRLTNLPTDTETLVRSYLTQVEAIETQMNAAITRLTATQVDDIKVNTEELPLLRSERKKIAREIASQLDIPYMGASMNGSVIS